MGVAKSLRLMVYKLAGMPKPVPEKRKEKI